MKFNLIPCISSMIVLAEYEISLDRYSSIKICESRLYCYKNKTDLLTCFLRLRENHFIAGVV